MYPLMRTCELLPARNPPVAPGAVGFTGTSGFVDGLATFAAAFATEPYETGENDRPVCPDSLLSATGILIVKAAPPGKSHVLSVQAWPVVLACFLWLRGEGG